MFDNKLIQIAHAGSCFSNSAGQLHTHMTHIASYRIISPYRDRLAGKTAESFKPAYQPIQQYNCSFPSINAVIISLSYDIAHNVQKRRFTHTNNCVEVAYTHPEKKRLNLPASTLGRSGWLPNHSQTLNGQAAVPLELLAKHFVKRSQFHNNGQRFRTIVHIYHVIHWSTLCVYLLRHMFFIYQRASHKS